MNIGLENIIVRTNEMRYFYYIYIIIYLFTYLLTRLFCRNLSNMSKTNVYYSLNSRAKCKCSYSSFTLSPRIIIELKYIFRVVI